MKKSELITNPEIAKELGILPEEFEMIKNILVIQTT